MAKRPTVYDVAHEAGVSIATVSFTFRQPERVRESTRATVMEAARRLSYVPSASARGLAHGRTGALGLYSFDMLLESDGSVGGQAAGEDPGPYYDADAIERAFDDDADAASFRTFPLYVDEVQRGFELECARRGRALLIGRGPDADADGVIDIASRVDGLAVFPGARSPQTLDQVSQRIPVVAFAMAEGSSSVHHVRVDNIGGVRALVDHLAVEHGVLDAEFVGAPETADYAERFAGMQVALRARGRAAPERVLDPTPIGATAPFGEIRRLAAAGEVPRALVCASDQHALDVMALLAEAGLRVPEDVIVTGFDGVAAGRVCAPSLTTVRQPMEAMGRLAVDILMGSLEEPERGAVDVTLPVRPLFRESCGCSASC